MGKRINGTTRFISVYDRKYSKVKTKLALLKAQRPKRPDAPGKYGGTLSEWMTYWLEALNAPYIKKSSYGAYRTIIETHLNPAFGSARLSEISAKALQNWLDGLSSELAPGTVHNVCRVFSSILAKAVDRELIPKNPFKDVRKPKYEVKKARYLSRAEQKILEESIRQSGRIEYLVCLYTGLRLGELCALRWEDVDFLNNELHVHHTIKRVKQYEGGHTVIQIDTPKTVSSIRDVPVPAFLMRQLKLRRKEKGFVFENAAGRFIDPRVVQSRFTALAKRAGISGAHMHTLRHTYATRCLEAGIQYETLAELLGHSSPLVTMKCYAHCTAEQKHRCVSKLRPLAVNF